jgi:hypothetical protein
MGGYDQGSFLAFLATLQVQNIRPLATHKLNNLGFGYKQQINFIKSCENFQLCFSNSWQKSS